MAFKIMRKAISMCSAICGIIFLIIQDEQLDKECIINANEKYYSLVNRILIFIITFIISTIIITIYHNFRLRKKIKTDKYEIVVKYKKDILKIKNKIVVIPFDECFTTSVGTKKHQIKETSICGQYLSKYNIDVKKLINKEKLEKLDTPSLYNNKDRYKSGTILLDQNNNYLLAFANLDKDGLGYFETVEDYLECLNTMWEQINLHNIQQDVCIPILGGGLTRIGESKPSNQQLVDYIIDSYKLSQKKIGLPNKLIIICRRKDGVLIDNVEAMM